MDILFKLVKLASLSWHAHILFSSTSHFKITPQKFDSASVTYDADHLIRMEPLGQVSAQGTGVNSSRSQWTVW